MKTLKLVALVAFALIFSRCKTTDAIPSDGSRHDGAKKLSINVTGSLQNPAFSPDGKYLLLTRFRGGYNIGPADLVIVNLATDSAFVLVSDGSNNVNLPGSCWNEKTHQIIFSSSRDPHDEIYTIADSAHSGSEHLLTSRQASAAYEPSLSPDGSVMIFESHPLDIADHGSIVRINTDGSGGYVMLTDSADDCRQPNWSPHGDQIVYQRQTSGHWHLWTMDPDGKSKRQLTSFGNETDGSFSHDGNWIYYSSDSGVSYANIFRVPVLGGAAVRITQYDGYDGAPSVSPDGTTLAFESYNGNPDLSAGTTLWLLRLP